MQKGIKVLATIILLGSTATPAFAQSPVPTTAIPSPVYMACPTLTYNLYIGLSDYHTQGQVTQLQQYLAVQGYYQPVTGYFGSMTRANVAQLQQKLGVYPITGGVGPLTRAAIARLCVGGTTGGGVPTIGFSVSPQNGTAPLGVQFSIATVAPDDMQKLYIDFGDGSKDKPQTIYCFAAPCSPAMTAVHTYQTAGTYTARLYRDNNYCPPGMYCTLVYREPTLLGVTKITVN